MADLGKVVYLSEAQKETLFTQGSITVDGVTIMYSDNDLYVTPSAIDLAPVAQSSNLITSGGVYAALEDKVSTSDYTPIAKTIDMTQAVGKDANGQLWTGGLPSVSAADNGKVLTVVDGIWAAV